jgi:hypothetical protein
MHLVHASHLCIAGGRRTWLTGHDCADAEHREVLRYYDVPQTSLLALLAPETVEETSGDDPQMMNAESQEWAEQYYFNDRFHPGPAGHLMCVPRAIT